MVKSKEMKRNSRRFLKKILLGGIAGIVAYFILILIQSPWEDILAALLTGSIMGIIDRKRVLILLGALSCSLGWLLGNLLFGIVLELGLGAWICAGASLGLISGLFGGSLWRGILGLFLGALAGLLAETSRYLTVFSEGLRLMDMQLILLVMAGTLLPFAAALVAKSQKKQ